ncbi:hypothetical protein [Parenemella sanctibonifatiensis]|uniref:hypothetical protein n=1 Tax=Parenemella sanctibonifatiensis TaxID=2016505 RepID=UPI001185D3B5|nr:hypothetical protein [Parenemella sanctibonifatiensis]
MKGWSKQTVKGIRVAVAVALAGLALTGCSTGDSSAHASCNGSARNLRPAVNSFIEDLSSTQSHGWTTEDCGSRGGYAYLGFTFEGTPDQLGEELTGLGCSVGDGDPVIYECSKGRVDFSVTTVPSAGDEDTTEGRAFMTATH